MRVNERVTPLLAAITAASTLACCLPVAGLTFLGIGSALGLAARYEGWLMPLSIALLLTGGVQTWRSSRICRRASRFSLGVLGFSTLVVLSVLFFRDHIMGWLVS